MEEARAVLKTINCRYSNYIWYILLFIGLLTTIVAIGVVLIIIGIMGLCGSFHDKTVGKVQFYLEDQNRLLTPRGVQWGLHPGLDYLHLCTNKNSWNPNGGSGAFVP